MTRAVVEHAPNLYELLGVFPGSAATMAPVFWLRGERYELVDVRVRYVLYRRTGN